MKLNNSKFITRIFEWDERVVIKYNSKRNKVLVFFLKFISFFGKDPFWDLLIAFYLLIWYNPVLFSYIGVTFLNGVLVNLLVKKFTNRDRPYLQLESVKTLERPPSSKSFPSWHAYTSAAETLVISYIFHNPILSIVLFVLSILICFSRIQLGVHYPSDVIIGYVIGLLGGIITIVILGPLILNLIQYFESLIPHLIYHDRINPLLSEPWYALVCVGIFVGLIFYTIYRTIGKQKLKEILLR